MEVRTIMMRPVVVVREDTTLEEIARMMLERHIRCVPVVNDRGEICGIVTESDFTAKQRGIPFSTFRAPQILGQWMPKQGIERIYEAARTMTAREIMTARVVTRNGGEISRGGGGAHAPPQHPSCPGGTRRGACGDRCTTRHIEADGRR